MLLTYVCNTKIHYGIKNGRQHLQMTALAQVHDYWLKFDDLDVYPHVFWGKEHNKTTMDITELLNHYDIELMTFSCPLSPNAQTPLSIE